MTELERLWSEEIARAAEKARSSGRESVADYLELRARNDVVRNVGVSWLIDELVAIAASNNRGSLHVQIEREEPHQFSMRGSSMSGTLLRIRNGIRCLTLEAGWTRTPSDGFMRGGALAAARFTHFGMPKAGAEIGLFMGENGPFWIVFVNGEAGKVFAVAEIEAQFRSLVE